MTLTARPIETGSPDSFERHYGRVQMYGSTAFILGALVSAGVAHFASLRLEYFLTIPFTCCAFFTLRRFREPTLHRQAPEPKLSGHLGQVVRAVLQPTVALIIVAAVAGSASVVVMCATLSMIVVKRQ
jgi:hypothetical protein